jgi:hypothetical protein
MSTANIAITDAWTPVVAAGQDFLLTAPADALYQVEVAIAASADDLASRHGHALFGARRDAINRTLIGPGIVYARTVGGVTSSSLVVTAWTPT